MGKNSKNNSVIELPSVLAFEKKLVPSDGFLYGTTWAEKNNKNQSTPLKLIEKSVRGTISNRLKEATQNDPLKLNAEIEKANLQTVDACALGENQDTLQLKFTLKILGNLAKPSACNKANFQNEYENKVQEYIENNGFKTLAQRYALNLANARYLWRNRLGAEQIEVLISANTGKETVDFLFKSHDFKLNNFDNNQITNDIQKLADLIAHRLADKIDYLLLEITANAKIGNGQEVYPSEELVLDKEDKEKKGKKSKILYAVNNVAALHSQKIGNALRTIDTWYPTFNDEDNTLGPIAIETYGSVTSAGRAMRGEKPSDFYSLFDNWILNNKIKDRELNAQELDYVMAVLIRGGVFGKSDKAEKQ